MPDDILNWCTENKCGRYPEKCAGVNHPALCPLVNPPRGTWVINDQSIIEELKEQHAITAIVVPCPCSCDANSLTGKPVENCPYCYGDGKIQNGIDEVGFL
jgi:hypothetical protein